MTTQPERIFLTGGSGRLGAEFAEAMSLKIRQTTIPEVLLVEPQVFADPRGFFLETFHRTKYAEAGLDKVFVQDNHSRSCKGTIRGLHYQLPRPQGKLVYIVTGEIFDVAVDIRRGSPHFGKWAGQILSESNKRQFYIPPGFAHGFCVLSEIADVTYKCTELYSPSDDRGILWSDDAIGIDWPSVEPLLSDKDAHNPPLSELSEAALPVYYGPSSAKTAVNLYSPGISNR